MAIEFETDTRCGECGERLRGHQYADGTWGVVCACGNGVSGTSREWIEAQFCKPYAAEPFSEAPVITR